jgi:glycosyltransferase involved in cell wall biosynthesis
MPMSVRVLHVLESVDPEAGSVAVCLGGLHAALAARGLESAVVTAHADAVRIPDGADVVHIHGWGHELAPRMAAAALKARKPYIVSPHGALTYGPYNRPTWKDRVRFAWRTRRLVRGAACVTFLNTLEEQDLHVRRVHPHIRALPYGLDFSEYHGDPMAVGAVSATDRCLLVLGPLHPRGGCVALLKAVAEIGPDANGWNIVLAGKDSGEWRKMLEAAVRRKKGDDRVVFTEAPTVAAQLARLAGASVLVAPDLHIGLPVSIMQAVAMGVPVIASTCVAPPGLDGAIRVCGPHREELREALRSVLKLSDEFRRVVGEKARTVGRAVFDWSVLADQYAQLYRELA